MKKESTSNRTSRRAAGAAAKKTTRQAANPYPLPHEFPELTLDQATDSARRYIANNATPRRDWLDAYRSHGVDIDALLAAAGKAAPSSGTMHPTAAERIQDASDSLYGIPALGTPAAGTQNEDLLDVLGGGEAPLDGQDAAGPDASAVDLGGGVLVKGGCPTCGGVGDVEGPDGESYTCPECSGVSEGERNASHPAGASSGGASTGSCGQGEQPAGGDGAAAIATEARPANGQAAPGSKGQAGGATCDWQQEEITTEEWELIQAVREHGASLGLDSRNLITTATLRERARFIKYSHAVAGGEIECVYVASGFDALAHKISCLAKLAEAVSESYIDCPNDSSGEGYGMCLEGLGLALRALAHEAGRPDLWIHPLQERVKAAIGDKHELNRLNDDLGSHYECPFR